MFDKSKKFDQLYQKGDWEEIIKLGEKLSQSDTEDIKILNDLAVAYRKKNKIDAAYKVCEKICYINHESDIMKQSINLGIRYMRYHSVMGEILYMRGEYDRALKIFESLKSLGSNFSEKFNLSAKIYCEKKRYDLALNEYQNLIKKCSHRINDAIRGLLELVVADPTNEKVYNTLFEAYSKEGTLKKEIALYEQSVKNKKNIFDVYIMGNFYRYSDQADKAIALFSEYKNSDNNIPLFLGNLYFSRGNYQNAIIEYKLFCEKNQDKRGIAIKCFEKILNQVKDDEELIDYVANLCLEEGDFAAAEEKIKTLISLKPKVPAYQAKLETLLLEAVDRAFMEGNLVVAKEKLKQLMELKPEKAEYSKRLHEIEGFISQNKIREYEEILNRNDIPEEEKNKIRFELADIYLKRTDDEKNAISLFQKVAKSGSQYQPEALCRVGISFLSKGMVDLAEENFKKVRETNMPEDKKTELFYQIGNAYEGSSLFDKAREIYNLILSYDITYRDVAQRLENLPANAKVNKESKSQTRLEDRYENIEKIGTGGMGSIYRAKDKILGRLAALKVIRDDFRSDTEAVQRFIREAQSASTLQHPGIVTIFDIHVGEPLYIAMELVDGGNLREKLNRHPMPVKDFLKMAADICDALEAAHSKGIIHRDIKPENIMLTKEGKIKITDFGLASISTATKMTMVGQVLGTPLYMPPEQIQGKPTDNRSDIYSLGVTFYEMLTGNVPFSEGDIGYRHIHETPESPSLVNPAISDSLEKIILKTLEKKPENRYQSVREIQEDLKKC